MEYLNDHFSKFSPLFQMGLYETALIRHSKVDMTFDKRYNHYIGHYIWVTWLDGAGMMSKRYKYVCLDLI